MTRRITYYIVFVTLIWGAHTEDEEKVRDMFKSNMTRNDFSNLLKSLINLNEQRVGVLQKLYRLEDYGVLSEVLRSGNKKKGNGNPNDLFLIVMSKNQNDPSRRQVGFQVVDSVSSLDAGNNNIHPKLDFVLDPAGYFSQNIRKEYRLESVFENVPRVYKLTKTHQADDRSKKITTTTKTLKNHIGLRAEVKLGGNVLRASKTSLQSHEDRKHHKDNSRFEIVSNKGKHPNASEKLLNDDGKSNKYPQTVGYNSQSNEYLESDFPIENDKLTTKSIIIKHIISSNNKNSKSPIKSEGEKDEDDYSSPLINIQNDRNRQYTKKISDISIKKLNVSNHHNLKTNKNTPKVIPKGKGQRNQQNDKLTTKRITIRDMISSNRQNTKYPTESKDEQDEDYYGSPFSNIENDHNNQHTKKDIDIPIKKLHVSNHHNLKTNKNTPKVKDQRNQPNDKLTTKRITIRDMISSNRQNTKYPTESKDEQDEDYYGSPFSNIENDHNNQHTKKDSDISIKKLHVSNHHNLKTNKNTPKVKDQRNQQNDKLTTKRITIRDMISSNRQNTKYPTESKDEQDEDYYGSPFSNIENDRNNQHTKKDSDISIKKLHVSNHHNLKTNKNTPKVKVQRNQPNDKLTTKRITIRDMISSNRQNTKYPTESKDEQDEDYYGSPFSNIESDRNNQYTTINNDVSIKKLDGSNQHNPKTNKNIPKVKVQRNQQNDKVSTKGIIIEDIITSNQQNTKYPTKGKDEQDKDYYGSPFSNIENDHNNQYTRKDSDISTKKLYVHQHNPETNKNISKIKVQRNQQNDKMSTKAIIIENIITSNHQNTKYPTEGKDEDYYGSPFSTFENDHNNQYTNINSDISIKKLDVIHHNPKINNNTPNIEFQNNQYLKLNENKSNINNQGNRYSKLRTNIETTTRKNGYRIKYGIVNSDAASENNHSIKNTNLNNNNTNDYDLIYNKIKHKDAAKEINNNKFLTPASENVFGSKTVIPETTKDTHYEIYPGFEDHKDVIDNSKKDKPKIGIDMLYGSYPGLKHIKVVRDNLNKDNLNTAKELPHGDNVNAESKKNTDYYGVKMFDNGKKSNEEFSIVITNVGNGSAKEVKQQNDPKLILNAYDQLESKFIARKPLTNCLNKKASKLCCKSCISAYKNVCQRLKCTSRSQKALKKECKRSCKKTFKSSSSKYSNENSDGSSDENSDGSSDETSDKTSDDSS